MSAQIPPPDFWRAILDIHNCYFELVQLHFLMRGRPQGDLLRSFQTMDVWLDQAIEHGWIEEQRLVLASR